MSPAGPNPLLLNLNPKNPISNPNWFHPSQSHLFHCLTPCSLDCSWPNATAGLSLLFIAINTSAEPSLINCSRSRPPRIHRSLHWGLSSIATNGEPSLSPSLEAMELLGLPTSTVSPLWSITAGAKSFLIYCGQRGSPLLFSWINWSVHKWVRLFSSTSYFHVHLIIIFYGLWLWFSY